nr:MAG TPA: hypothetical protein [Caudoviricetes sp.]
MLQSQFIISNQPYRNQNKLRYRAANWFDKSWLSIQNGIYA